MGYSYDDILYDRQVQVYVGEDFDSLTDRGELLCVYVTVDAWVTSGSGWGVRGDCYTVTVEPGETACFSISKLSTAGQPVGMTALTTAPTGNPLDALYGKNQLQTLPGGAFKYLTNTTDALQTWYVTTYVGVTQYSYGLSDVGDIEDAFDSQKTPYEITIWRLDDSIAPEMPGEGVGVTVRGGCLAVGWSAGTDEGSAVVGYEFRLTGRDGAVLAEKRLGGVLATSYNGIVAGEYTVSVRAVDLAGNVSDWSSSVVDIDEITGFCHGFSGTTAGTSTVTLDSVTLAEGGFYYFDDFTATKGVSGTITLYSDLTGKKVGSATVSKGKISAAKDLNLGPGTYTVKLRTSSAAGYSFFFAEAEIPAPTGDNDFGAAAILPLDAEGRGSASGFVGYSDAVDIYRIDLVKAGSLTLNLSGVRNKLTVAVYNEKGKKLKSTVVAGDGTAVSEFLMTGAGYISIGSYDKGKGAYNSEYTLSAEQAYFPDSENDSRFAPQGALALGGAGVGGWVGYGDAQDFFSLNPDDPGRYDIVLSEARRGTNVRLYRVDTDKKGNPRAALVSGASAGSTGKAVLSGKLLDSASHYVVMVEAPSAAKGVGGTYKLALSGEVFGGAGKYSDDVWSGDGVPVFACSEAHSESGDWVGFGDAVDYRKLAIAVSGSYTFALSGLSAGATLTLYRVKTDRQGNRSLAAIKSATGSFARNAVIAGRLLGAGDEYYLGVKAPGASSGKNTYYTLGETGTLFDRAGTAEDDDWRAAGLPTLSCRDGAEIIGEWVGFGDAADYRKLAVAETGEFSFRLSGLESGAKLVLYTVKTGKNGVGSLKVWKSAAGKTEKDAVITGAQLTAGGEYYVGVFATGAATGKNTPYNLAVTEGKLA